MADGQQQQTKRRILDEIPVDEIREAAKSYAQVRVFIQRQNQKGQWASIGASMLRDTLELLTVADWLKPLVGGGSFRVEARNPESAADDIVPPFWVHVEGAPRAPRAADSAGFGHQPQGLPPGFASSQYLPSAGFFARDRDESDGTDPVAMAKLFMTRTPDQIASEQVNELRQELIEARRERTEERKAADARIERLIEEGRARDRQHSEDSVKRDRELLEQRIEALTRRPVEQPRVDIVAAIAAVSPLLIAFMESGTARTTAAAAMQTKATETQLSGMQTMMTTMLSQKPGDNGTLKLLEFGMPLVMKFLDERSPGKVAELVSAMGDQQMTQLSLFSQFMQQLSGDQPDNVGMQLISEGIKGLMQIAEKVVDVGRAGVGGNTRPAIPVNASPTRAMPAPQASRPAQPLTENSTPQQFADAIISTPGLEPAYRTQEWYDVFAMIHDPVVEPAALAKHLGLLLEKLEDGGKPLPAPFTGLFQSDGAQVASSYLEPLLRQLPLVQYNETRLVALLAAFDQIFVPADDAEEGETAETEAVSA